MAPQNTGFDTHWEESQPGSGWFSHSKAARTSLNRVGLGVVLGLGFLLFFQIIFLLEKYQMACARLPPQDLPVHMAGLCEKNQEA